MDKQTIEITKTLSKNSATFSSSACSFYPIKFIEFFSPRPIYKYPLSREVIS